MPEHPLDCHPEREQRTIGSRWTIELAADRLESAANSSLSAKLGENKR
jgi:hypothetical protein